MRILLVEDEIEIANTIKEELEKSFIVDVVHSGKDGEYQALMNMHDLIILDMLLPDSNGIDICKKLRAAGITTPILMLTGQYQINKKVLALDSGADDYLTKPFNFEELSARLRALLRRQKNTLSSNILSLEDLTLDLDKKVAMRQGKTINLPRKELYLLEYLLRNVGRVVTRNMILDHVWETENESFTNTIDVHIKYLRDRVDRPFAKKLIKTVHGMGYKIEA